MVNFLPPVVPKELSQRAPDVCSEDVWRETSLTEMHAWKAAEIAMSYSWQCDQYCLAYNSSVKSLCEIIFY